MTNLLIVEDEVGISMVLKAYLTKAGYTVDQADDGERALALFEERNPALVLLDVMLPDTDGWTILRRIRERSACPVIMLTALADVKNRVAGLKGGADDYIGKPFSAEEVVARVQAVLRRLPLVASEEVAIYGSLKIDYAAREVELNGSRVALMPRDLALLLFLTSHPNRTFDREQLIELVWGADYEGSDRAVDMAVKRIRRMLTGWPSGEGALVTLRRVGYQFRVRA
jgi:DNA-binding response OmpR family regulator